MTSSKDIHERIDVIKAHLNKNQQVKDFEEKFRFTVQGSKNKKVGLWIRLDQTTDKSSNIKKPNWVKGMLVVGMENGEEVMTILPEDPKFIQKMWPKHGKVISRRSRMTRS